MLKVIQSIFRVLEKIFPWLAARIAFYIFYRPRRKKYLDFQEGFLSSADHSPKKNGLQWYHWTGKGKTVFFLHGWESNSSRWIHYVKALRKLDYNIYAVDAVAHGKSDGNRFAANISSELLKDQIDKIKPDIMVGHSVGAYTLGYLLSKVSSHRPEKLVLLAPNNSMLFIIHQFGDMINLGKKSRELLVRRIEKKSDVILADISTEDLLQSVSSEITLVHDIDDEILPFTHSQEITRAIPSIHFIQTKGLGHKLKEKELEKKIIDVITN